MKLSGWIEEKSNKGNQHVTYVMGLSKMMTKHIKSFKGKEVVEGNDFLRIEGTHS